LTYTSDDLLKLIHDTEALSIWNREKGPVFWYAAGVPGPFYFNIELMISKDLADGLLQKITAILAATSEPAARAGQLNKIILEAYASNRVYAEIIATLVAKAREQFPTGSYSLVSGGERRDWLFSIPFAKEMGIKHAFLFKNQTLYCEQGIKDGEQTLHVSDLINNAASYFDVWLPTLEKAKLKCFGTGCVVSRGVGTKKLEESGVKVMPLIKIDLAFFEQSLANGLITQDTLVEIASHFNSPREWARKYLVGNPGVFDIHNIDKKAFERLQSFLAKDPWSLRSDHEEFFVAMQKAIATRQQGAD
jgi:orotate phosphoribosyltransferase